MGVNVQPKLIIHGGAGSSLQGKGGVETVRKSLYQVIREVYGLLEKGTTAEDAVIRGCQLLEDDPLFNAGVGSVLQSDGQIRMSAALMNGSLQRFSGVINVSRLKNPIELAKFLQTSPDRVLSDYGAAELLRELNIAPFDPLTDRRLYEWIEDRKQDFNRKMANVVAETSDDEAGRGTIGVVALDQNGRLAAGTSTGGKGFERIGRVSDSAMPAGNYATAQAGVSCTGIGEDIIDECLAAKIVIRVGDGLSLRSAFERSFVEANDHQRDLGAIGLDASGAIAWGKTSDVILAAFHNGQTMGDSLEMLPGTQVLVA
ncbi:MULTISPECIES: isoaspartyl peptidase/L-asparaginase [Arthrospira]|jgi:L-asparaginase|uniref:L-asparaginase n=1 Tax=Limnospira platensis NIES-46 TaxID=1236695 RepID=A0A5M3TCU3_LIMPL|nr:MULTISPECIES: isoaspartyl peptidase/L-asparaginase [Arthrospira]KDR55448.1 isoaspartyl peptidase [Arthrospira platensis str. Paraca]MBD2668567.1 isoaspartyl peptidase/L-asparaginase [Arthrospira platensis FACHB-439]MBD2709248.1 isoaspartyl peptidase/L-asparaginase [Arthrospira platensis FACHB-835]MDF2211344.1 isoaspartyl peptidase/L-asparaginase [Arthrospira platensis NCB002]MDT9181706.1 isoaspartyl peptidase/L-asparaginase [Limnospira sp. PMC 289.06]MDT9294964.1 isoaspartyl peptidase/L-as